MATIANDLDMLTLLGRTIHNVTTGIAPHKNGAETEEYRRNVPVWLRHKRGLPADEVAALLAVEAPELGIESERDLYDLLNEAQTQRRNNGREGYQMQETTVDDKEAAIRAFAAALATVNPAALAQIREAWRTANKAVGHKLLAPALLGDMDRAVARLSKLEVN